MAKKRKPTHVVVPPKDKNDRFVGTIDPYELMKKVRKPYPPTTKTHRQKKAYRRRPKHPTKEQD